MQIPFFDHAALLPNRASASVGTHHNMNNCIAIDTNLLANKGMRLQALEVVMLIKFPGADLLIFRFTGITEVKAVSYSIRKF